MPTSRARSPFDRPRWNEEDAREVIAALDRSGKPVSVFAAEHGLDAQRVNLWRRRFRAGSARAERSTFRELVVRPSALRSDDGAWFEVCVASGTTIRMPSSFDPAALARLLEVLVRSGAC